MAQRAPATTAADRQLRSSRSAGESTEDVMMIGGEVFTHRSLPRWVQFIQEHIILGMLIIAEMVLNGTFMTTGITPSDPNPLHWGVGKLFEVGVMFAGGAVIATMTVFSSFAAAIALLDRIHPRKVFGTFMFIVAMLFAAFEVWAGLYERSQQSVAAMIDLWVMDLPAGSHPLVSPTLFILAFVLPLSALVVGFATQQAKDNRGGEKIASLKQRNEEALLKAQAKQQLKLLEAEGKAQRKVIGRAASARADFAAEGERNGRQFDVDTARFAARNPQSDDDDDPTPDDDPNGSGSRKSGVNPTAGYGVKSPPSRRLPSGLTALKGGTAEFMSSADVVVYISQVFGQQIDAQTARDQIVKRCDAARDKSRPGAPLAAPKAQVVQRVGQFARAQGWERVQKRSA